MKRLFVMNHKTVVGTIALIVLAMPLQSTIAAEKPFPGKIYTNTGSPPEGFAIGSGTAAYNGSVDGSIYKMDLRTGKGGLLVQVQDPDVKNACVVLGMRVDPRTNYLFVAGCVSGKAYVYDADNGTLIMEYQLGAPPNTLINDLTITQDAVYFTDANQPFLYRLPLSKNGQIPLDAGAATAIPLTGDFVNGDAFCCAANGIVATPDGKTLIIDHSNFAQLFRVNPATGVAKLIPVDVPLEGFLDGLAMNGHTLYVMSPGDGVPGSPAEGDRIQVVSLDNELLSATRLPSITDPDLDGVASGAIFGDSLYVNNARYSQFDSWETAQFWITKLKRRP